MNIENWIDICRFDELTINDGVSSLVAEQQIAIFKTSGQDEVFAIGNYDPIGKANVLSRGIVGDIKGELVVSSPLYKQHFSLRSGQCLEDDQVSVPSYPTKVVEGRVLILFQG